MIPVRLLSLLSDKPISVTTIFRHGITEIRMAFDNPFADVTYQSHENIQNEIETQLVGQGYQVEQGQIFDKVFSK